DAMAPVEPEAGLLEGVEDIEAGPGAGSFSPRGDAPRIGAQTPACARGSRQNGQRGGQGGGAPTRAGAPEFAAGSAAEETAEDTADNDNAEADATERPVRGDEEPQSFLAMYFRDMAELDVLRPEQEFETARLIEDLELELWRKLLGFAPAANWT